MIGMHYDTTRSGGGDPDGVTDSNDPWFRFIYDGDRLIATYRESDALANPKEHFYSNKAGLNGLGAGSYINDIFKRERDHNTNWYDASDGTMERGDYLCRNWRGDTAAVLTDGGNAVEYAKYSAYGYEKGIPAGDCEDTGAGAVGNDGDVDILDLITWSNWFVNFIYDVRGDLDLDGDLDIDDYNILDANSGNTLGRGNLSLVGVRSGYAGYQIDPAITTMYHVRARKFSTELGRFLSRDPAGFLGSLSLYEYSGSNPVLWTDPSGLGWICALKCAAWALVVALTMTALIAAAAACIASVIGIPACLIALSAAVCALVAAATAMIEYCQRCGGKKSSIPPGVKDAIDTFGLICLGGGAIVAFWSVLTGFPLSGIAVTVASDGYAILINEDSYEEVWHSVLFPNKQTTSSGSGVVVPDGIGGRFIARCTACG